MNAGYIMTRSARYFGGNEALLCEGKRLTYRELNAEINALANSFLDLGFKKGDRVGLLFHNSVAYVEAYLALYKAGLVWVRLNYRLTARELAEQMDEAGAVALVHGKNLSNLADEVLKRMKREIKRIDEAGEKGIPLSKLLAEGRPDEPDVDVQLDDLSDIWFTSGTTGEPKGIMITHRNIMTCVQFLLSDVYHITSRHKLLTAGALSHAGSVRILPFFLRGGLNVILERFDPEEIFRVIERERITDISTVPTMLIALMDHPRRTEYDLSSIETITYAGAPMPVERIKEAIKIFGPVLSQSYGQAESIITITHLPKEEHIIDGGVREKRLASVGREYPGVRIKVVREDGQECRPNEIGEVITRSDLVMRGYWNKPDKTAEAIVDGWLHTGDLGYLDEDGYLYLVDRKNDKIITGGLNVYPREVEEVLAAHPGVAEVSVFGVSDDKWGEAINAAVVLRSGVTLTERELLDFCDGKLARYKLPKRIHFLQELPKNTFNKVMRKELGRIVEEGKN